MASAPVNHEEFVRQYNSDSKLLFDSITELVQRVRSQSDLARSQLTAANQNIDSLEEQINQLSVDLNIARAGHTSTATIFNAISSSPVTSFRSEKFPDPEKFNGTRSKLPGFLTQLQMKLEVNDDRFRNENTKIIYSISRLERRALDQVVPLVNSNPSTPFSSLSAFLIHLESYFGDPDPRGTARRELVTLKQGSGDFATYYSKFLRIIAYLDSNEAAKIDAIADGLSDDLKDAMIYHLQKQTSLEGYATMLMATDSRIRGRKAEQKMARNSIGQYTNPNTTHPLHVAGGLAPMDLSASQMQLFPRPKIEQRYTFVDGIRITTPEEKQWRRENNRCMYRAGSGHSFENCTTAKRPRKNQTTLTGALLALMTTDNESVQSQIPTADESDFH